MKTLSFYLIQFTWGIVQNILGLIAFVFCALLGGKIKPRHKFAFVCEVPKSPGSVSLGCFLLVTDYNDKYVLNHEYGHTLQSLILGVFYLIIIGLPSFIWAWLFKGWRKKRNVSYYDFYTERWANQLVGQGQETSIDN
jgi:hypothetical protein